MSRIACAKSILPNTSKVSSVNASVLSLHGHYLGVSPSDPNCSFICPVSDRSFALGGVGERTGTASLYAATFRVCESVRALGRYCRNLAELRNEREANEPTDTLRVGVMRSSIDSYERTVLAHRRTIAAN